MRGHVPKCSIGSRLLLSLLLGFCRVSVTLECILTLDAYTFLCFCKHFSYKRHINCRYAESWWIFCALCLKSGLTQKSRDSQTSVTDAESELLQFVKRYTPPSACPLAGNSVHVDKLFLARYMPEFVRHLHYRIVDVSTVKELCRWRLLTMCTVRMRILRMAHWWVLLQIHLMPHVISGNIK